MYFERDESVIYSDTQVPDIFLSEYLPSMKCEYVKVYIYSLFLCKHGRRLTCEELSKRLSMETGRVNDAFLHLESLGVLRRKDGRIILADLKQKEINKIYRMKTTSTPEEAARNCERNKHRNKIISAINDTFFQGVMSPSWYTDIDAWFDKYGFEEDVMYTLFQHCYDHKALTKSYICKVAESWHSRSIKNSFDLDKFFIEYKKKRDLKGQIIKKLKLARNLTEYEDEFIEKWSLEYGYDIDIIEIALKKTTARTHPNFRYLNGIVSSWHKAGLSTRDKIMEFEKNRGNARPGSTTGEKVPQHLNFEQREYGNEFYDDFFDNSESAKGNR